MNFSRETFGFLKDAGWFPDRNFDTTGYERSLKKQGYPVHDCVLDLLKSFGGLYITCYKRFGYTRLDHFHFNATKAVKGYRFDPGRHNFLVTGKNLCAIGENWGGHGKLEMDEEGAIYIITETTFNLAGKSPNEAIENLCQGLNFIRLHPLPSP